MPTHTYVCCIQCDKYIFPSVVSSGGGLAAYEFAGTSDHTFIPTVVSTGGDPAAHGLAGTSDHASLPSVVSSGGDPAAHGFAGTSDNVYWTARDAGSSDLTRP